MLTFSFIFPRGGVGESLTQDSRPKGLLSCGFLTENTLLPVEINYLPRRGLTGAADVCSSYFPKVFANSPIFLSMLEMCFVSQSTTI